MLRALVFLLAVLPRVEIGMGYLEPIGPAVKVKADALAVTLRPSVVMVGGAFWLRCHVPRDAHNRLLEYGVADLRPGSQRQLEGADSPITWAVMIEHVTCDAGPAYCAVQRDDGTWTRVVQRFEVAGCN